MLTPESPPALAVPPERNPTQAWPWCPVHRLLRWDPEAPVVALGPLAPSFGDPTRLLLLQPAGQLGPDHGSLLPRAWSFHCSAPAIHSGTSHGAAPWARPFVDLVLSRVTPADSPRLATCYPVWSCSLREDRLAAGRHAEFLLHPPGFKFQPRIFHSWMFCLVPFQTGLFFSQHLALSSASDSSLMPLTAGS